MFTKTILIRKYTDLIGKTTGRKVSSFIACLYKDVEKEHKDIVC